MKFLQHPELLVPAGSADALSAAINGGADAVYFGGTAFNARQNAKNFDRSAMRNAIDRCHFYGVRTNITFNTLLYEKEYPEALRYAEFLYNAGADALIVADFGLASAIKAYFPQMELHASTQASIHNTDGVAAAKALGFSRTVLARELPEHDVREICKRASEIGMETEMFIHGALCVSVSGQCLFSSLVGGRSGNRGECAQPCRLPYQGVPGGSYPLSLKDLSLADRIPEILSLGVSSLKIEGRMRSPEYVYTVTRIYRRLLDEERAAEESEKNILRAAFSRSGFTDAYFTSRISDAMCGTRTEKDKKQGAEFEKSVAISERKLPVQIDARFRSDCPTRICIQLGNLRAEATGATPMLARSAPITKEDFKSSVLKLGSTPFSAGHLNIDFEDGLFLPKAELNRLRRNATEELYEQRIQESQKRRPILHPEFSVPFPVFADKHFRVSNIAVFSSCDNLPGSQVLSFFDEIYISAYAYAEAEKKQLPLKGITGIVMPAAFFDHEKSRFDSLLRRAKANGIKHAVCENIGQIALLREIGFQIHGGFRLNVYSAASSDALLTLGVSDICLSPELCLAAMRDISLPCPKGAIVYGSIPLMTLEKCIFRCFENYSDSADTHRNCPFHRNSPPNLVDRRGVRFPVLRDFSHRNVILNSVPVYMADRSDELLAANIQNRWFLFNRETESAIENIVHSYRTHSPANFPIRRM